MSEVCCADECDREPRYKALDERGKMVVFCRMHYTIWAKVYEAGTVQPPGMRRMRGRLAKVELEMENEPTDMQRYLENEELNQKTEEIQDTLAKWEAKFGEE